jgi:hypothetical protein
VTTQPAYDAHGPEAWSLGRESYAHLGYMVTVGPHNLRHHLIHAHGVASDVLARTVWVDHVELHATHHEVRVRSCALRDIAPSAGSDSASSAHTAENQ